MMFTPRVALTTCRNCKWVERWTPIEWGLRKCLHPDSPISPVSGGKEFANIRRLDGSGCGQEGRQWELHPMYGGER